MQQEALRKAAILIATADHKTADALLDRLDPEQAAAVRRCAIEISNIDPAERDKVFNEFSQRNVGSPPHRAAQAYAAFEEKPTGVNRLVPRNDTGGIDLGSDSVVQLRIPGVAVDQGSKKTSESTPKRPAGEGRTLDLLRKAGPDELAQFLATESPQTIAVVFSHLLPAQGAAVLTQLPDQLRSEVLSRLTRLEAADEQIMQDVEQGLQQWLDEQARRVKQRRAGVSAVVRLLDETDVPLRRKLLAELNERDRELVDMIENVGGVPVDAPDIVPFATPALSLEAVARLDTATLTRLLDACDQEVLVIALAGAEPEVVSDIVSVLGLGEGRQLRSAIANVGPVRLRDVDACQQRLGELAAELVQANLIDRHMPSLAQAA